MTASEFNEKYEKHLVPGHYGLDIHIPEVIDYLNLEFEDAIEKIPDLKYTQIKLKFQFSRVYLEPYDKTKALSRKLEKGIDNIIKQLQ